MKRISRRKVLTTSAAAFTAPVIIPSSALGLGGKTAPSNRISVGLIGLGLINGGHRGWCLNNQNIQILAVCDVDRKRREDKRKEIEGRYAKDKASGTYKGCAAYNEYEKVVERDDIDAVFVTTPDHWHAPISVAAMRNKKDVYVEKPMTLTIEEGKIMRQVCEQYGRVLQVGTQQRSNFAFRKAAEIVRNGWIGNIHTIHAGLGSFALPSTYGETPIPDGFDYDRWLGPTPWYPYHIERVKGNYGGGWRRFWEYGSRKNGDWGAHHFDIIQWALDKDDSGPTEFTPKGYQGAEYQSHKYEGGPLVVRDHPERNGHMIHFIGTEGTVSVSRGNRVECSRPELVNEPLGEKDIRLYQSDDHRRDWLNAIHTRQPTIANVNVGHRTATICQVAGIAERLNRPITWDPETETIVDDPQAARWTDRPRRAPYVLM